MKKPSLILLLVLLPFFLSCTQDTQQKILRKKIEYFDGDFKVTFVSGGQHIKQWNVKNGKITTVAQKGYYFFWARDEQGKKFYVQTPIARSYIEQIKE